MWYSRRIGGALALLVLVQQAGRGDVLVSSRGDDRVARFSDSGQFLGNFIGTGAGGLDGPIGLRVQPVTGELLVSSNQSSEVLRYNANTGASLGTFAATANLDGPSDLAFAQNGDLYAPNFGTSPIGGGTTVARLNSSGTALTDFATGLDNPTGVVFGPDPDGPGSLLPDVYVSNFDFFNVSNNSIRHFNSAGAQQSLLTHSLLNGPSGLTLNPSDGKLYAASLLLDTSFQNHVLRFDLGTEAGEVVASGGSLYFPAGILFLPNGDMLVSNAGDGRIVRFNPSGGSYVEADIFNDDGMGGGTGGLSEASQMLHIVPGDFDDDNDVDAADIDILWHIVRNIGADPNSNDSADLNGDTLVNEDDVDSMLAGLLTAGANRAYGDANLSGGTPELTDFNLWRTGTGGWAQGDFDGSGGTPELTDFNLWRTGPTQFPTTVGSHGGGGGPPGGLVPEPATLVLIGLGLPVLVFAARRRNAAS